MQNLDRQLEEHTNQKQLMSGELQQLERALERYVDKVEELTNMREDAKVLKQAYDVWQEKTKIRARKKKLHLLRCKRQFVHMRIWNVAG